MAESGGTHLPGMITTDEERGNTTHVETNGGISPSRKKIPGEVAMYTHVIEQDGIRLKLLLIHLHQTSIPQANCWDSGSLPGMRQQFILWIGTKDALFNELAVSFPQHSAGGGLGCASGVNLICTRVTEINESLARHVGEKCGCPVFISNTVEMAPRLQHKVQQWAVEKTMLLRQNNTFLV